MEFGLHQGINDASETAIVEPHDEGLGVLRLSSITFHQIVTVHDTCIDRSLGQLRLASFGSPSTNAAAVMSWLTWQRWDRPGGGSWPDRERE